MSPQCRRRCTPPWICWLISLPSSHPKPPVRLQASQHLGFYLRGDCRHSWMLIKSTVLLSAVRRSKIAKVSIRQFAMLVVKKGWGTMVCLPTTSVYSPAAQLRRSTPYSPSALAKLVSSIAAAEFGVYKTWHNARILHVPMMNTGTTE